MKISGSTIAFSSKKKKVSEIEESHLEDKIQNLKQQLKEDINCQTPELLCELQKSKENFQDVRKKR